MSSENRLEIVLGKKNQRDHSVAFQISRWEICTLETKGKMTTEMRKELNLKILENKNCANGDGNKRTEESAIQTFQLGTWKNSNKIIKVLE